jgi:cysteinyl-tRNA synthetase
MERKDMSQRNGQIYDGGATCATLLTRLLLASLALEFLARFCRILIDLHSVLSFRPTTVIMHTTPTAFPIRLQNTLSRSIENFTPVRTGEVSMYSCGPTVYNYAHIGNMRAFLFADLLHRVMRVVGGYRVRWVMNITDIDDKTIRDSAQGSEAWRGEMGAQTADPKENLRLFTEFYASAFRQDIAALGIEQKNFFAMPYATHYIPQMQQLIQMIADKGFAYERGGSVYFDVNKWRHADKYGKLFEIDFENFQAGVRIDADEYERESVSDFVLWKGHKDGEPAWEFTFRLSDGSTTNAQGRPGWHIECSAMEREILGLPFDIHTGGIDLKFPHHEDEIAQSKAGYGIEPTTCWCHNDFLEVEGEKMSKSKGNYFTLRDLLQRGIDPLDVRWLMLAGHYATKLNFTFAGLEAGRKARMRIQDYIYDVIAMPENTSENVIKNTDVEKESPLATAFRTAVFTELAEDLNTPKAIGTLFTFMNQHPASSIPAEERAGLLGFFEELNEIFVGFAIAPRPMVVIDVPAEVQALAEARWQAKKNRQFAESDGIRAQITALGFVVKDSKDGYAVEPA